MAVVVNVDISGADETIKKLIKMPSKLEKIRNRALVRTKDAVITASDKAIREKYTIKAADVKEALKTNTKLSVDKLEIAFKGRTLTPARFSHTPKTIPTLTKTGKRKKYIPTVTIFKGSKKKLMPQRGIDGKMYPVFLGGTGAKSSEKIQNIFFHGTGQKNRKGRMKLKAVKTVSVPQMLMNEHVIPQIQQAAVDTFMKRFEHEAKRVLEGNG